MPLAALRDRLALCAGPNWGRQLRYGLLGLAPGDLGLIAAAMAVPAARLAPAGAQAA